MPPPKLPSKVNAPPQKTSIPSPVLKFSPTPKKNGQRVVLYGPGGIGKTTLACLAPGPVAIVDAEESIGILQGQLEAYSIDMPRIVPANDWNSLRAANQSDTLWGDTKTIVYDTGTRIEAWAVADTIRRVKTEKDKSVTSIEGYGYGKGFQYVYDTFELFLTDLDRHTRAGRNVIVICHDCIKNVPNPSGEDWIRYEPRLQDPTSGKASIRLRLKEWADHVLFIGYDVVVEKDSNKAQGCGSRTLYTTELPHCMAKSRTTSEQFVITQGESPWAEIIK